MITVERSDPELCSSDDPNKNSNSESNGKRTNDVDKSQSAPIIQ